MLSVAKCCVLAYLKTNVMYNLLIADTLLRISLKDIKC